MEQLAGGPRSRQLLAEAVHSLVERGADKEVRAGMNFKYVSFDWVEPCGWFFWPRSRRGVYQLKEWPGALSGGVASSRLSLHYYPHPDESVFGRFSFAEQLVRVSELFSAEGVRFFEACPEHGHCDCHDEPFRDLRGGKGIPVPDARERLAAGLYWVGGITLGWRCGELEYLIIEAQERSRTWAIADIPGPQAGEPVLRAGDIDRDVPCWQLAWLFATGLAADLGRSVRSIRRQDGCGVDALKRGVIVLHRQ